MWTFSDESERSGRNLVLQAATGLVVGSGVTSWVLGDQHDAQLERDRGAQNAERS